VTRSRALVAATAFAVAFLLLLPPALRKGFDHDEHQFVAAGALLAGEGLLPYRDYPYFHVPNLPLVYAALFTLTDHRLLAARLFSVACAAGAVAILVHAAAAGLSGLGRVSRLLAAAGTGLLLLANPVFRYTTGRTWNHDFPTLLTLLAVLCVAEGLGPGRRGAGAWTWVAASGLLVGAAAGARLTYLPAVAPFALVVAAGGGPARRRLALLRTFGGGVALGLLPALALLAVAPEQFLFGNFAYRAASTLQKIEIGHQEAMTLAGKLRYLKEVLGEPGNLALAAGLAVFVPWARVVRPDPEDGGLLGLRLTLLVIPFLLGGSLVATPTFYQYLYAPVPFAVLGVALALAWRCARGGSPGVHLRVFLVLVAAALAYGYGDYRDPGLLLRPREWFPTHVRAVAREIRGAVGEGPVLTMAPTWILEGGMRIYPEFATGPFAWRSGHLVPKERRERLGVVSPEEFPEFVAARPPRGILVGFEERQEPPLVDYARARGYRPLDLPGVGTLWVAPEPAGRLAAPGSG
jgi:hypothetical protein